MQLRLTEHGTDAAQRAIAMVHALLEDLTAPIGGTRSLRGRDLARTSRILGTPLPNGGADDNRRVTMPATPTLTLTGQDIGEAYGATRALLDRVLADTGYTSDE